MEEAEHLEHLALLALNEGDLSGAGDVLRRLVDLRPGDSELLARTQQLEALAAQQAEAKEKIKRSPLRFAQTYIQVGRYVDALRLLRMALKQDPENERLKALALEVGRRAENGPESVVHASSEVPTDISAIGPQGGGTVDVPSPPEMTLSPLPEPDAPSVVASSPTVIPEPAPRQPASRLEFLEQLLERIKLRARTAA